MNRPAELAGDLPQKRPDKGLLGDAPAEVVCRLEKQDMTVRLFSLRGSEPVIEMALGSEARSFSLSEFLHFWLTIVEVGLKRDIAQLESGEVLRGIKRGR
jgi:hypothetical protein